MNFWFSRDTASSAHPSLLSGILNYGRVYPPFIGERVGGARVEVTIETGRGRRAISVRHLNLFGPGVELTSL